MSRSLRHLLAVASLGVGLLAAVGGLVLLTGRAALVVTHGVSMQPVYYQGDLVVVARRPAYEVGQIVAYRMPERRVVVLHRVIARDATGLVFKGDNNQSVDPARPTPDQLIGKAVLHVPSGGTVLRRLTGPPAVAAVAFCLLVGGSSEVRRRSRRRRASMSRHTSPSDPARAVSSLPPALRTAAAVTAATGALALALGGLAWTRSTNSTGPASTAQGGSMVFSYTAKVGRTAAYDGTSVSSPDPVFRRVADTVDVHLAYRGRPGSMTVGAELSTASGWHSTVPLAPRAQVTGAAYDKDVRLDLKPLESRARAGSQATGLPSDPLTIRVTAQVQSARDTVFEAALPLTLTPLQLSLVGGASSLTVGSGPAAAASRPATLVLLGREMGVATARVASVVLLLAALLAAMVLAAIARITSPSDEAQEIHRRYAGLLVRVHPVSAPAGRPVVDVTEFATLAKLAERYGLLVLHWSRSGVDTFVVQDEGSTYRYRTGPRSTPTSTATPRRPGSARRPEPHPLGGSGDPFPASTSPACPTRPPPAPSWSSTTTRTSVRCCASAWSSRASTSAPRPTGTPGWRSSPPSTWTA